MAPAHRKPRKLLRTAFAVLTLLSIAGFFASGYFTLSFFLSHRALMIDSGTLAIYGDQSRVPMSPLAFFADGIYCGGPFKAPMWIWSGSFSTEGRWVQLPAWPMIALLVLACILLQWREWRRGNEPGLCRQCNYDLRGSADRCPECGHAPKALQA